MIDIDLVVSQVIKTLKEQENPLICFNGLIGAEASARHIHLSREHLDELFGEGYELGHVRDLSQPGQFLAKERVRLIGPKAVFDNVAILGPVRNATQAELSKTDCMALGINAPLRESGDIKGSSGLMVSFKDKYIMLCEGAIMAKSHIHMTEADAEVFNVKNGDLVKVRMDTERPLVFEDVIIRVRNDFKLMLHIDYDEANACLLKKGGTAKIVRD